VYVSDTSKVEKTLGWKQTVAWEEGLERLVGWLHDADLTTPVLPLSAGSRVAARPQMAKVAP
jgi:dTDP-D-glucose 4,6-dehydratase